jgi:hypothetical protein
VLLLCGPAACRSQPSACVTPAPSPLRHQPWQAANAKVFQGSSSRSSSSSRSCQGCKPESVTQILSRPLHTRQCKQQQQQAMTKPADIAAGTQLTTMSNPQSSATSLHQDRVVTCGSSHYNLIHCSIFAMGNTMVTSAHLQLLQEPPGLTLSNHQPQRLTIPAGASTCRISEG